MKAWVVSDTSHDWTEVVFAPTRHEVFYKSDGYQCEGNYTEMRGYRNKAWDQYDELGYVPKEEMLKDGFWFECSGYKQDPFRRCCAHVKQDDNYKVIDERVYYEECAGGLANAPQHNIK